MILSTPFSAAFLLLFTCTIWPLVHAQMLGVWAGDRRLESRQSGNNNNNNNNNNNGNGNGQNGNNNGPDTSAFTIVNGRVFTPGLGIILAPQPFTPMGGDFLHIALDVSGDGKLAVPPRNINDALTQVYNFTLFLTSDSLQKNFTISNFTTQTPPFANILDQELGQTVKHINFEWPECLVGDGNDNEGGARGDYNISIHQNYKLNGFDRYTIFNLPISVSNSINRFPGAGQLSTNPIPGPLSANGGRMQCENIQNQMVDFQTQVASVNNPPGQPIQDIPIETSGRGDGGQVGGPGQDDASGGQGGSSNQGGSNNQGGSRGQGTITPSPDGPPLGGAVKMTPGSLSIVMVCMMGVMLVLFTSASW